MSKYEQHKHEAGHKAKPAAEHHHAPKPKLGSSATRSESSVSTNPTYLDARLFLIEYFEREFEVAHELGVAAQRGFDAFKVRTSDEYNRHSSVAFALFEAALAAVPGGAVLFNAFRAVTRGQAAAKAASQIAKKAAEWAEAASKVSEAGKKIGESVKTAHENVEGSERGDFHLEVITDLAKLASDERGRRWQHDSVVKDAVRVFQNAPAEVDLVAFARQIVTPLPSAADLGALSQQASEEFELKLYLDYYVTSKKAALVTTDMDDSIARELEGIPDAVTRRFVQLGRYQALLDDPALRRIKRHTHWTGRQF